MPHIGNFPIGVFPRSVSIAPTAFVPSLDTQDWEITTAAVKNRAALTLQHLYAPIILPERAKVQKLTLYGNRNDGDATLALQLSAFDRTQFESSMAQISADWTDGYNNKSSTEILNAVVDNDIYCYALILTLDPNDSVDDVRFTGARIDWN